LSAYTLWPVVVYFIDYIVPPSGLIQPRLKPWCSVQGPYKKSARV